MKRICFIILLLGALSGHAQSVQFYGITLGQTYDNVKDNLSKQGLTPYLKKGFLYIDNPVLGNCSFNYGKFCFYDGRLNEAEFSMLFAYYTNHSDILSFSEVESYARIFIDKLLSQYVAKYGKPHYSSDKQVKWNIGNNSILIKIIEHNCLNHVVGSYDIYVQVIYKNRLPPNNNF